MEDEFIIKNSKKKVLILLLISFIFVVAGVFMICNNDSFDGKEEKVLVVGCLSLVFFGLGTYVATRQLISNKGGLTITEQGLLYDKRRPEENFIYWNETI